MRVSQGGLDGSAEKLVARFPRTLMNLQTAIRALPHLWIFDNDDLRASFRLVAVFENGRQVSRDDPVPHWLVPLLAEGRILSGSTKDIRPEGFEPTTLGSEDQCSIQLSYGRVGESSTPSRATRQAVNFHSNLLKTPRDSCSISTDRLAGVPRPDRRHLCCFPAIAEG